MSPTALATPAQPDRVDPPANGAPAATSRPDRLIAACLVTLTLLAVLASLYVARAVLVPVTLAVMFALVLRPVVAWFRGWGVPNVVTATLLFLAVGGLARRRC